MASHFHIKDVIDVDVLQKIQDEFATATGFAVIIVDAMGRPVTKHSNCSDFCSLIRKEKKGKCFCEISDSRGGLKASRTGKPYIYRCHTGLVDFASPIVYQGHYLGAMMAGQVLVEEEHLENLEIVCEESIDWKKNQHFLDAYNDLPVLSFEKIKAVGETMSLFCNYIVEKGITNKVQKELHEKDMKLAETKQKQLELENALKETKLKVLQAQINPHFLFNALNTISSLCIIEKASKTQEVVYILSDILRYTLRKTSKMVSLGEELKYIERYLQFQKTRFHSRLNYKIFISKELETIEIPFMTLQPLVENAIIHGLEPKEEGGIITIIGYPLKKDVLITIEDNGVGIPPNKLKLLLNNKEVPPANSINDAGHTTGLGIHNVNDRLVHYYGQDYSLKISSISNSGTRITVTIPSNLIKE
ncbi:sensor histidine kinase [Alkalibacter saccharofermentans]|uniref:histidine kinase n=1 Tax=Alkalibacter saccharofermentans DSM 14828 TaxID=1120975 RepID=A0A1M4SRQ6_9FIRM|nr:PocR ligand-binding domain-containing protein [Alkalibacter saccharofermentans]SHE34924.1 Histidine kinase-, DNA gyrase B-, and HSP90-like ATPase [Alkalibacter saccharofermentans DSM 14828]